MKFRFHASKKRSRFENLKTRATKRIKNLTSMKVHLILPYPFMSLSRKGGTSRKECSIPLARAKWTPYNY
ncbi:MAG TPA: hypothetical protein DCZ41_03395 [Firmicutes bacterium]|nr:hypothetical protein [Bacillota bacterium]